MLFIICLVNSDMFLRATNKKKKNYGIKSNISDKNRKYFMIQGIECDKCQLKKYNITIIISLLYLFI